MRVCYKQALFVFIWVYIFVTYLVYYLESNQKDWEVSDLGLS